MCLSQLCDGNACRQLASRLDQASTIPSNLCPSPANLLLSLNNMSDYDTNPEGDGEMGSDEENDGCKYPS